MMTFEELKKDFEISFEYFVKYLMYPPNSERKIMVTLNDRHIAAVARAESFMSQGITPSMSERHQTHVRKDIDCLREVRQLIRIMLNEPGLPFALDPGPAAPKVGKNGHLDKTPTS